MSSRTIGTTSPVDGDAIDLDVTAADRHVGVDRRVVQAGREARLAVGVDQLGLRLGVGATPGDVRADVLVEEHVVEDDPGARHGR